MKRALALLVLLSGCAVGPDFERPAAPKGERYTAGATPSAVAPASGGASQRIAVGEAVAADWWRLFRSERLDGVIGAALQGSRTIAAARATLAAARENVLAARGGYWPRVDFAASVERAKGSALQSSVGSRTAAIGSPAETIYSLGPTVSYAPDVFGATRRQVEQQQALADLQGYELGAAYLTLTGNAVTQAITIASLRAQIQAAEDVVSDDMRNVELVQLEFEAGKVARTDVLTAQTQLASDRTLLPPLRQQLAAARHALAILTGRSPAQWSPPDFDLKDFTLPGALPLSLPSALVRQRPDILAAEAQLHADSAAIGIATAQLYPGLTLSASLGQTALDAGSLFNGANAYWSLAGQLAAPLFHGGTLEAQRRAAIDTYRAQLATYEQTVLQAFQQVADSLRALEHDAELLASNQQLLDTATDALQLQRASYEAGKSSVLQLIDAERSYQQARLGLAKAQAQRLQDTAQLLVALGGGWWDAKLERPSSAPQ
ncbi:MAG TPA: efflux transporter outer membrane subunit [Burkholderiales bacterium]|nr:efflux transporter outer membrane subunit [Burkholderiales bacterium]